MSSRWPILWRLIFALLAAAALLLCPLPVAEAQTVAKTQFVEAKKKYEQAEYQDALIMFQYAWEHSKSPNARLYIAKCFHKLGQTTEAYVEFRGAMNDAAKLAVEEKKYEATRDAAAAELALLDTQIGRLLVVLDDGVPGAQVSLNGEPLQQDKIGIIVPVLPGRQRLVASAEGKADVVRELEIAGGELATVPLFFAKKVACDPDGAPAPPPPQGADGAGLSSLQIVGVIMLGVGLAGLGVSAATGAAAGAKLGSLEQTCGDERCADPTTADVVDSGKTFETISYISLGVGAGLAVAGTVLLLIGGDDEPSSEGAGLAPLPGGGLLTYRASF